MNNIGAGKVGEESGNLSCVYNCFLLATWNLARFIIIPLCVVFDMLDFISLLLFFNGQIACPELVSGESRNNHFFLRLYSSA